MAYESSVEYEWADAEKTVVRRMQIDYHDLAGMQDEIEKIDAMLAALPREKEPPDTATFAANWGKTGLTHDVVGEMFDHYNMNALDRDLRESLIAHKYEWENRIERLRAAAEGTGSKS